MTTSLLRVLPIAMAILAISANAHAYVLEDSSWDPATLPIGYRVNESTIPSELGVSVGRSAIENGFATWAAPDCSAFRAVNSGTTAITLAEAADGENSILWLSDAWPAELGDVNSVIGVTTPLWGRRGFFIDADIQFNNVGFTWSTTGRRGTVDAESIATHEEGHFLGLDHSGSTSAVMYASYAGGLKRALTSDDEAGVCAIYLRDGATPPTTTEEDRCAPASASCGDCTPNDGCGWCGATSSCVSGTREGPSATSCASDWVWLPRDCSAASSPSATEFGGSCAAAGDCASDGLCVGSSSSTAFCTRECEDDCGCPSGYGCVATNGGVNVCAPGTNSCSGSVDTDDAGTPPTDDAGEDGSDAGPTLSTAPPPRDSSGCSVTRAPSRSLGATWATLATLLAIALVRRRRSA